MPPIGQDQRTRYLPVYGEPRIFVWTNEKDTDGLRPSTENQC